MIQPNPDPAADNESSSSVWFEFSDFVIPLPPGIPARNRDRSRPQSGSTGPSADVISRRGNRFQQITNAELLLLWKGSEGDQLLRDAVLAEAKRRVTSRGDKPIECELREILGL